MKSPFIKLFLIFSFLYYYGQIAAQSPAMDSLLNLLNNAKEDTNKVNLLYALSEECPTEDILMYSERSLELAQKLNYKKGIANAYNNIGYVYDNQGRIQQALDYFMKALKIHESIGNKDGMSASLTNLGSIYIGQGDKLKALELNFKSLAIEKERNNKQGIANCLYNIGSIYSQLEEKDKALEYSLMGYKIHEEMNDKIGMGYSLNGLGNIYKQQEKLDEAAEYYLKSLAIREEIKNPEGIAMSLINVADVYMKQKKYEVAINYSHRALQIANEIGYAESVMKASQLLSRIYIIQGNYKSALEMYMLFKQKMDNLNNIQTQKTLLQKEFQYEYEKKEAAAKAEQDKREAVFAAESSKRKMQLWSVIGGLVLVIVFAAFFLNRWQVTREQKKIIEVQKKMVETKNRNITDSIHYAERIQNAILPKQDFIRKTFNDCFILFLPKDVVSGDFYWAGSSGDKIIFAVADCTGHGVPGAFMSMMGSALLNEIVNEQNIDEADEILNRLKNGIVNALQQSDEAHSQQDGMEIGLCVLDKKAHSLSFSGAYNSLFIFHDGKLKEYKGDKQAIGYEMGKNKSFTKHVIPVHKNESIYLFTDGYADQKGGTSRRKFFYAPFKELITSIHSLPMEEQKIILHQTFNEWKGNLEQIDDVLVMGIRI